MAMYCPQCNTSRPATTACAVCGGRLLPGQPREPLGVVGVWMQSPVARIIIGLVVAQGLFQGLRQFLTGLLLTPLGEDGLESFNASFAGTVCWQLLQGVTLLLGAGLAGSGESFGFFYGTLVGVGNGLLCSAIPQLPGTAGSQFALYGQPLIQAGLGLFGGWLGSVYYRPLPEVTVPSLQPSQGKGLQRRSRPLLEGPIHWVRVTIGAVVACAGALSAAVIFDAVLEAGQGRLNSQSYWQDQIFTWEIKVLALLLGGGLAGANTANGFKQGLIVGLAAALVMAGVPRYNSSIQDAAILFSTTLALCIAGGWFGGQLLPPIVHGRRPRNIGPMA